MGKDVIHQPQKRDNMNDEQEQLAQQLIDSAFTDTQITKIAGPINLVEMLAKNLRDDPDLFDKLVTSPEAVLLTVKMNELTESTETKPGIGALEIELVAQLKHKESPLLQLLGNPSSENYAYAIAIGAKDEDDLAGLMLIFCTRTGENFLALALDDDERTVSAWNAENEKLPDDLAKTVAQLSKAVTS